MKIGYARVSTDEQNLDLQRHALQAAGCEAVYEDQGISGAENARPGLAQALGRIAAGDVLVVWKLDRLGRSLSGLIQFLDGLGIAHATKEHAPVFTVAESVALRDEIPGGHTKNLFVKDKKSRLFLISALEDTRIDLKRVHEIIGGSGRVSFGSADLLGEVLGVEPGSVTPFAAINDREGRVTVVLDRRLMEHARINVHPLVNTMTTGVSREDLVRFLASTGHEPQILAVGEAGTAEAGQE